MWNIVTLAKKLNMFILWKNIMNVWNYPYTLQWNLFCSFTFPSEDLIAILITSKNYLYKGILVVQVKYSFFNLPANVKGLWIYFVGLIIVERHLDVITSAIFPGFLHFWKNILLQDFLDLWQEKGLQNRPFLWQISKSI